MQNWKNIVRVLICLGLICTLCSCRTAAGRSAGQVIDDMNLTTVIKSQNLQRSLSERFRRVGGHLPG